jgi:hypothetical protein
MKMAKKLLNKVNATRNEEVPQSGQHTSWEHEKFLTDMD